MPKTRLSQGSRSVLQRHATKLVECPKEHAANETAHTAAYAAVRKMVETRYPPKDMAVLKRYGTADACLEVRIQLAAGGVTKWWFRTADKCPLSPSWTNILYITDEATTKVLERHQETERALKDALSKKLSDYVSLISAANTFEDVLEVWPEAEAVRSQCGASAIIVAVTPEVVARIRADVRARAKAA